ncbi:MAG: fumarylacetoacetate hydrolase family protein, partial [Acidobacteriota bacterium]
MALKSWIESANGHPQFPLENLPLGVFRAGAARRIGMAIGDQIFDAGAAFGIVDSTLNPIMDGGRDAARDLRRRALELLRDDAPNREQSARFLVSQRDVSMELPCTIGDYTDFYASIQHATNVGSMFRPDNPLLPNYKWLPVGYHGRASSVVVSGTPVRRPEGQTREGETQPPLFGPSKRLDYEMEMGVFIGRGNALGTKIPVGA